MAIPVGGPFDRIAIDVLGPLPVTPRGNEYVVVCTDYMTKWVEAFPTQKNDSEVIARVLVEGVVCKHGCPRSLLTDRGSAETAKVIKRLCQLLNTKQSFTQYRRASRALQQDAGKHAEKLRLGVTNRLGPLRHVGYIRVQHVET